MCWHHRFGRRHGRCQHGFACCLPLSTRIAEQNKRKVQNETKRKTREGRRNRAGHIGGGSNDDVVRRACPAAETMHCAWPHTLVVGAPGVSRHVAASTSRVDRMSSACLLISPCGRMSWIPSTTYLLVRPRGRMSWMINNTSLLVSPSWQNELDADILASKPNVAE